MTKQELIDQLHELETRLQSKDVEDKFIGNIEFTKKRGDLGTFIGKLDNAAEAAIAQRLDELSPQFQKGIDNLTAQLQKLKNLKQILTILATILDLGVEVFKIVAKGS